MAMGHIPRKSAEGIPIVITEPFNRKVWDNYKLFRRKHGVAAKTIAAGQTSTLELVVPYTQAKINEAEIFGGRVGDTVDFKVYDNVVGTVQQSMGIPAENITPNLLLNQFGFDVQMPPNGVYKDKCHYDADVVSGMKIEITYKNNGIDSVTVAANVTLHELQAMT